jgi:hypothetical protein
MADIITRYDTDGPRDFLVDSTPAGWMVTDLWTRAEYGPYADEETAIEATGDLD